MHGVKANFSISTCRNNAYVLVNASMLEETEENKKSFKIVMLDSQESRVNRSQGLKK